MAKVNAKVIGTFYFEITGTNGDLKGNYLNNDGYDERTETAVQTQTTASINDPFEGTYHTNWNDSTPQAGQLTITKNNKGYDLLWSNVSPSNATYKGVGMNYKGTLIGGYWKE
jgi:hypothetical protein